VALWYKIITRKLVMAVFLWIIRHLNVCLWVECIVVQGKEDNRK